MKNIYVIGVFDLFHIGHLRLLQRARALGSRLIVAVNGDQMVSEYKRKPIYNEEERLELVSSCRYVDEAFIIRQFDNKPYLLKYNIDAIIHGDDWEIESYLKQIRVTKEFLETNEIEMKLLTYTPGVSSSDIIKRIKNLP